MVKGNGISNIDNEIYFENETNDDLKKTSWAFIHQIPSQNI